MSSDAPRPAVLWFTGLPGSGKTTLARLVSAALEARGLRVERLDGDGLRERLPATGFSKAERDRHVENAGRMASDLEKRGVFVVASLISPYAEARRRVRGLCANFIEIFVSTPLEVCEKRDPKGLYAKARRGELRNLTGIDDPYEPPFQPEISVDTSRLSEQEACSAIMSYLEGKLLPDRAGARAPASHLDQLENRSIHILREAYSNIPSLAMLWSIGKDSTVLLYLARKAFFGHVPFPLVHIDTSYKIPEMIEYRDRLALEWGLTMVVGQNEAALKEGRTFPKGAVDRLTCCGLLKTQALKDTLSGQGVRYRLNHQTRKYEPDPSREAFTGVIVGIRADEEGSRAKERYFSPRDEQNKWVLGQQPPEFWNQYKTDFRPGTHVRIHPLLDWREVDIWDYIDREKIPTVSLYYAKEDGKRYRSLGCHPCTLAVDSPARNPREIAAELKTGKFKDVAERSGRAQDKEDRGTLEDLRRQGYM